MNNQEFFDRTVEHLRKQNCQAKDDTDCKYRTVVDGVTLMCAVGCHLTDDIYKDTFEGHSIYALMKYSLTVRNLFSGVSIKLIRNMQCIHDNDINCVEEWEEQFKYCAEAHGLIYTPKKG